MNNGFLVCGLDESGRGALAGPIVFASVVLPYDFDFSLVAPRIVVRDSKTLSNRQRNLVYQVIKKHSLKTDVEVIWVDEINQKGIGWANLEGFRRLILRNEANQYLIDGRWRLPDLGDKNSQTKCVVRGDQKIPSVMSAGIVAKIKRDRIMKRLDKEFPGYGWVTNTGHGTAWHIKAIKENGACHYHRTLFVQTALRNKK